MARRLTPKQRADMDALFKDGRHWANGAKDAEDSLLRCVCLGRAREAASALLASVPAMTPEQFSAAVSFAEEVSELERVSRLVGDYGAFDRWMRAAAAHVESELVDE